MISENERSLIKIYKGIKTTEIESRLAAKQLTLLETKVAYDELENRLQEGEEEVSDTTEKNERSLIESYEGMETAEIKSRLAAKQLTLLEAKVACDELENRRQEDEEEVSDTTEEASPFQQIMVMTSTVIALTALWYFLLPRELFFLCFLGISLPRLAGIIGKLFPAIGYLLGAVLVTFPIWFGFLMWRSGAFHARGGDFLALEPLLAGIGLFLGSGIAIALGSGLLKGAKHEGTWEEFGEELAEQTDRATKIITD